MKKFLCIALMVLFVCSTAVCAKSADTVTMYAPDGRTTSVAKADVNAWKKVGWYAVPVTTMYALDGRTTVVAKADVGAWKKTGWYTEPVTIMYALDGRTTIVAKADVSAWKKTGWYTEPVTMMYAPDGRTTVVAKTKVEDWKKTGWYTKPMITIYAANGKSAVVFKSDADKYVKEGWNTSPILSKSSFLSKVKGWWVDLSTCRSSTWDNTCFLDYMSFDSNRIEMGSLYSEYSVFELKSLTFVGNNKYKASIYMPGFWYADEYFKPAYYTWTIKYDGGNSYSIKFENGNQYTYTFVGKYHDYESIQRNELVVEAAKKNGPISY